MMLKHLRYVFTILLLTLPLVGWASDSEISFQQLTAADGLPCNSIRCVHQDNKGFIWLGTVNSGLCRYDGRNFNTIYPTYNDTPGLPDPRIKSIYEDDNAFLWVTTMSDKICCYDLQHECFVDYSGSGDYDGSYGQLLFSNDCVWLWGRSQGCMRVRCADRSFVSEKFSMQSDNLPSDIVYFVLSHGTCTWIGTDRGMCVYEDGQIEHMGEEHSFRFAEIIDGTPHFISDDGIIWAANGKSISEKVLLHRDCVDKIPITGGFSTGTQWYIFTSSSTWKYDGISGEVEKVSGKLDLRSGQTITDKNGNALAYDNHGHVVYYDKSEGHIVILNLYSPDESIYWTIRYDFVRDDDGKVWISTHDKGLFVYDLKKDTISNVLSDKVTASGILMCIKKDRGDNFWLGTEFSGLFKLSALNEGISILHIDGAANVEYSDMVRMIDVSEDEGVWVCTRDGKVHIYSKDMSSRISTVSHAASVYDVCRDTLGRQWIGTRGKGVIVGDVKYSNRHDDASSLSSDNVFGVVRDMSGRMWLATFGGGLNLAQTAPDGKITFRRFFNDSYSRRRMRSALCDSRGNMWVGTSEGLLYFNPDSLLNDPSAYVSYNCANGKLRSDEVRALMEDSKGRIWIAESGAGFSVSQINEPDKAELVHYGVEDGLVNGLVQGFVEDKDGRIWISTEYGVSCFDTDVREFRNFIFSSKMQSNICLDNSVGLLDDGRLLFGTKSGLAVVEPDVALSINHVASSVVFTELNIVGANIESSVSYQSDIRLKHGQNTFEVSFSTLDYSLGTRYSYILDGYDSEWSTPSEFTSAIFRNLPPGRYELKVKACDSTGRWSEPSCLKIRICPPFYRTAVAYILYMITLLLTIYVSLRILKRINDLRNAAKVEKQMTEYKLLFFTNISHEFRTPLTLILHSLDKLKGMQDMPASAAKTVQVMETGTRRLLRLINQLLEFRKLQDDKHRIRLEKTEVVRFFGDIFETFTVSAQAKGLSFEYRPSFTSLEAYIDRDDMDKVVYNLLSNAIKYTPSGGSVCFEVVQDGLSLILKVTDTGVGITEDKRKMLFSRFTLSDGSESSMGLGLNLARALVEADKGEIDYIPNQDGGSIFTVRLPLDEKIFDKDDFVSGSAGLESVGPKTFTPVEADLMTEMPPKPLNPHKVLVIEDDSDIRRMIVEELSGYFNVIEAVDGESGLAYIAKDAEVEMVLSDVMMPGMSGYEVADRIKADFNTCHIPVVLLTALSSEDKQIEGFKSGADAYITKPFRPAYVLVRMLKLIEQRNRLREKFSNDLSLKTDAICTNDRDREFMDKIDRVLEVQLANPDFSMDDFASELAMGRSTFFTKIKSLTGYSPNKYIHILRMKKAAELLMTGEYTSAEVSYKVGIQDASYFSKSFKEQFGMSPKAYQKQAKESLNRDNNQDD